MTSPFIDTTIAELRAHGLHPIRTGNGTNSTFWSTHYGDPLTILVRRAKPGRPASKGKPEVPATPDTVALTYTISYDSAEKPCPLPLLKDGKFLQVTAPEEFDAVKAIWIARVKDGK